MFKFDSNAKRGTSAQSDQITRYSNSCFISRTPLRAEPLAYSDDENSTERIEFCLTYRPSREGQTGTVSLEKKKTINAPLECNSGHFTNVGHESIQVVFA